MVWCAISGCKNNTKRKNENINFHIFPTDKDKQKQWIEVCGKNVNVKYARICSSHFKKDCYTLKDNLMNTKKYRKLKKDAVPTLLLSSHRINHRSKIQPEKRSRKNLVGDSVSTTQ